MNTFIGYFQLYYNHIMFLMAAVVLKGIVAVVKLLYGLKSSDYAVSLPFVFEYGKVVVKEKHSFSLSNIVKNAPVIEV